MKGPFQGLITIGRARNNDIIVDHTSVSKVHAVFSEQGGDLDDVLTARQAELAMLDEMGIILDTDPSEVTIGGNAQPPLYQEGTPAFPDTELPDEQQEESEDDEELDDGDD